MRPPAKRQSALRAPLNDLFGTEGAVRLLRVLSTETESIGAAELARRAGLTPAAARRGLAALLDTGLVGIQGDRRSESYILRRSHPLASPVAMLFDAERQRAESLLAGIRERTKHLKPPPVAVWIEGAAARGTDEPGEPVLLRVIAPASALAALLGHLRHSLQSLEESLDVTIDVVGATPADLAAGGASRSEWAERLRDAKSVIGLPPDAYVHKAAPSEGREPKRRIRSHQDVDLHGLALAHAIARRLRKEPTLIARAKEFVEQRLPNASPRERHELEEWRHLLGTASPARIRRFLVDQGERATRLRQTLPFLGILTPAEREALLDDAATNPDEARDA